MGISAEESLGTKEEPVSIGTINATADPDSNEKHTQESRRIIVYVLLALIALTTLVPFAAAIFKCDLSEKHWEYLHIIFPAEIGLLSSAIAFFFDRRS